MEPASEGLDNAFLDGPKQGGRLRYISTRQHRCMLKLLYMEDAVKGVFSPEFIGPRHIDANLRLISTEGGPDFSSTLAEGDGRTPIFSQQEIGPPERAADHLNWESSFVGGMVVVPGRTFHRRKMIPQDGDETVLVSCPIRSASCEGFGDTCPAWQGRIEDGSPSMNESYGMGG